jgi:hypothetical protein
MPTNRSAALVPADVPDSVPDSVYGTISRALEVYTRLETAMRTRSHKPEVRKREWAAAAD